MWKADIRRLYGISSFEYDEMLKRQSGGCAICGSTAPGASTKRKRFDVDHSHATGKVRGLLCQSCNLGLGKFKDDLNYLRAAILYLENHEA